MLKITSIKDIALINNDDRHTISKILAELNVVNISAQDSPVLTVDYNNYGRITAAAVRILEHIHHFLLWDGLVLRQPQQVAALIRPNSFYSTIVTISPEQLPQQVYQLLKCVLDTTTETRRTPVWGLSIMMDVLEVMLNVFALHTFTTTVSLNWQVINTTNSTTVLRLDHANVDDSDMNGSGSPLLDGMVC